jgi:uncharacterized protein YodC (DUF2158 family)
MGVHFNIGEKVRLTTGGPDMVIRGTHFDVLTNEYRENMYDCIWFEKNEHGKQEVHYCPFYEDELIKAPKTNAWD